MMIINNKKLILSKCGDNLIALKISSLFKQSIYLSYLFWLFSSSAHSATYFLPDDNLKKYCFQFQQPV